MGVRTHKNKFLGAQERVKGAQERGRQGPRRLQRQEQDVPLQIRDGPGEAIAEAAFVGGERGQET